MNQYMVSIHLPDVIDSPFIAAVEKQSDMMNDLLGLGVFLSYAVSEDSLMAWIIMRAESKEEACIIIDSLPIREFIMYDMDELLFSATTAFEMPVSSLN